MHQEWYKNGLSMKKKNPPMFHAYKLITAPLFSLKMAPSDLRRRSLFWVLHFKAIRFMHSVFDLDENGTTCLVSSWLTRSLTCHQQHPSAGTGQDPFYSLRFPVSNLQWILGAEKKVNSSLDGGKLHHRNCADCHPHSRKGTQNT